MCCTHNLQQLPSATCSLWQNPGWLLCRASVAVPLRRRPAGVAPDFICCCVVPCCVPAQERREDLIRRQLDDLGALCADLGEEVKAAVMEVHPNLVYMWDAEAARVLRDVYRLGSSYSSTVGGMVDLGDTTISRLGSKILVMKDLKVGPAGCRHDATQRAVLLRSHDDSCSWCCLVLTCRLLCTAIYPPH